MGEVKLPKLQDYFLPTLVCLRSAPDGVAKFGWLHQAVCKEMNLSPTQQARKTPSGRSSVYVANSMATIPLKLGGFIVKKKGKTELTELGQTIALDENLISTIWKRQKEERDRRKVAKQVENGRNKGEEKSDQKSNIDPTTKTHHTLLTRFHNLVLEGVPGTGKTFAIEKLEEAWSTLSVENRTLGPKGKAHAITFHPSTSYEDFVEGLRLGASGETGDGPRQQRFFYESASADSESNKWRVANGFFVDVCAQAYGNPKQDYLILLDELNRANIPKVLGDLLTTLEHSRRAEYNTENKSWDTGEVQTVKLPYSRREFFVPGNVYVLATMNTTDRSVAPLDAALRRRFAFERLEPTRPSGLNDAITKSLDLWDKLNVELGTSLGPDAILGHSYWYDLDEKLKDSKGEDPDTLILQTWKQQVLPQLIESVTSAGKESLFAVEGAESKDGPLSHLIEKESAWLKHTVRIHGKGLMARAVITDVSKDTTVEKSNT